MVTVLWNVTPSSKGMPKFRISCTHENYFRFRVEENYLFSEMDMAGLIFHLQMAVFY